MKVKISKTINAGDIPSETRKMLDGAKNNLLYSLPSIMSEAVRFSLSGEGREFFHTIELIKSLREELHTFDEQLGEIVNIIQGYKDFLENMAEKQKPDSTEEQPSDDEDRHRQKMQENEKLSEEIEDYVNDRKSELEVSMQQWQHDEEAEYEKLMAQVSDADEVEDEEG